MEIVTNHKIIEQQHTEVASPLGLMPKELGIIAVVGLVFFLGGVMGISSLILLAFAAAVFFSFFSIELNFAFLLLCLHTAASGDERWFTLVIDSGRWVLIGIFALKGIAGLVSRNEKKSSAAIHWLLFFYGLIAIFSLIDTYVVSIGSQRTVSYWLMYFAIANCLWNYIGDREKVVKLIKISVFCSTMFLLFGLFTEDFRDGFLSGSIRLGFRYSGIYHNLPNMLGLAMVIHVPLSFYLYLSEKKKTFFRFNRLFYSVGIGLGIFSLIASGSRASIMGVGIAGMSAAMLHYRKRIIVVGTVAALFLGLVFNFIEGALKSQYFTKVVFRESTLDTMSGRSELWTKAYEFYKQKPMIGWGFGTSDLVMASGGNLSSIDLTQRFFLHVHSSFFRVLVETGTLGTLIYLLIIIFTITKIVRIEQKLDSIELHNLFLPLAAIFIGGLLNSFFESWLFSIGSLITLPFWFFVTVIYAFEKRMDEFIETEDSYRKPGLLFT